MQDTVVITRPAIPTFDDTTGLMQAHKLTDVYQGPARVYPGRGPSPVALGDTIVTFQTIMVAIPFSAPIPHRDDLVRVTVSIDPGLVGKTLRIIDVTVGGQIVASRTMTCTEVEQSGTS